jgi:bla regulator protein BlaR1
MTSALWLRNLMALAIQSTVVAAAGGLTLRVFRIDEPRTTLAFWRVLLLACLLLPFAQSWNAAPVVSVQPPAAIEVTAATGVPTRAADGVAGLTRPLVETMVLTVIVAGVTARLLWLLAGAWALARIRRDATLIEPLPDAIVRAEELVGARAEHYVSRRVAGPITFGLLHPIVVFPPSVTALAPCIQQAIACHELLHVRRRDWLVQVAEEGLRTLLWFHPAIWWLIGRIQLSREQVVDQAAVRLIASRDKYVEALLAVAIARSPGILTPAPAFLRRSVLKRRVAQILQESIMTTRRLIVSLGASAAVLALAATLAVRSFPLQAQEPPHAAGGAPVEIVKGGEHLLHGGVPEYPRRAIEAKVEGEVLLDLAVDDHGEVSDARVLTGPDELRKAALEAVLGWHYVPAFVRSSSTQATLRFHLPPPNAEFEGIKYAFANKEEREDGELAPAQRTERLMTELNRALKDPNVTGGERAEVQKRLDEAKVEMARIRAEREVVPEGEARIRYSVVRDGDRISLQQSNRPARLASVRTERVSDDAVKEVLQRAGVKVGDPVTEDVLKRVRSAARAVDEHFNVGVIDDGRGGVIVTIVSR